MRFVAQALLVLLLSTSSLAFSQKDPDGIPGFMNSTCSLLDPPKKIVPQCTEVLVTDWATPEEHPDTCGISYFDVNLRHWVYGPLIDKKCVTRGEIKDHPESPCFAVQQKADEEKRRQEQEHIAAQKAQREQNLADSKERERIARLARQEKKQTLDRMGFRFGITQSEAKTALLRNGFRLPWVCNRGEWDPIGQWLVGCTAVHSKTNEEMALVFIILHRTRVIDPDTRISTIRDIPDDYLVIIRYQGFEEVKDY